MTSPVIELENVHLEFHGETVLKDVSLKIHSEEFVVLIGPSGQGKSVTLKLMAGLLSPTRGRIRIEDQDWRQMPRNDRQKLSLRMGMLFQRNALFDSLTVAENIAFPLRETGRSEDDIQARVADFLHAVGLTDAAQLHPSEISGGMQKRLGIARALALQPEIVFYDDPTAGLDPITSRRIAELISQMKKKTRATVVAVTNDMVRAFRLADRLVMVIDQTLIDLGNPEQAKDHPDPRVQQFIRGRLQGPLTDQTA